MLIIILAKFRTPGHRTGHDQGSSKQTVYKMVEKECRTLRLVVLVEENKKISNKCS